MILHKAWTGGREQAVLTAALALCVSILGIGCAPKVVAPSRSEEPATCESAVLASPGSGPADFAAFYKAFVDAAPLDRDALVMQFLSNRSMPMIASDGTVVFVYVAKSDVHDVRIIGDFRSKSFSQIGWDAAGEPMHQIVPGSALWFVRMRFATDARLDYQIVVDGVAGPDLLNPRAIDSGMAASKDPTDAGHASELLMPAFHEAVLRSDVPHGTLNTVAERWAKPEITVYLPPNYDSQQRYPVLYTADGHAWQTNLELPSTLDALIASGAIEPIIAVMIQPEENRTDWYQWNPRYLAYLNRTIAYVDAHYSTQAKPTARLHAGTSAGARASLFVALEDSAMFSNIAMLSPGLTSPAHLLGPYLAGTKAVARELRVWMSSGRYEGAICEDTQFVERWLHEHVIATHVEYSREAHSFGAWKHDIVPMLKYFFAPHRR
jgi:enterochelin esterase family protein